MLKLNLGFLHGEYKFMNIKNPFYPTLEQWMQLDSQSKSIKSTIVYLSIL